MSRHVYSVLSLPPRQRARLRAETRRLPRSHISQLTTLALHFMTTIFSPRNLFLLLVSMGVGRFLRSNPLLLGQKVGNLPSENVFPIVREHEVLDRFLDESLLGDDYEGYRNHCLRVLTFAMHFLDNKVSKEEMNLMAMAVAYHDIALWTDGVLDYLEPSVAVMDRDAQANRNFLKGDDEETYAEDWFFTPAEMATAREIIRQHHKYTPFRSEDDVNERLINAVRKADWADATMGAVRYKLPASYLEAAYAALPEAGFHRRLLSFTGSLSKSFFGRFEVLNILKW